MGLAIAASLLENFLFKSLKVVVWLALFSLCNSLHRNQQLQDVFSFLCRRLFCILVKLLQLTLSHLSEKWIWPLQIDNLSCINLCVISFNRIRKRFSLPQQRIELMIHFSVECKLCVFSFKQVILVPLFQVSLVLRATIHIQSVQSNLFKLLLVIESLCSKQWSSHFIVVTILFAHLLDPFLTLFCFPHLILICCRVPAITPLQHLLDRLLILLGNLSDFFVLQFEHIHVS